MGLLWGIVKTVVLAMAAIIAILVAIDVILARNLFRPRDT
jgi:NADH:ubiquinone oxidoreductase subunit 6 (subunit J)